jgi:hypothetical protein
VSQELASIAHTSGLQDQDAVYQGLVRRGAVCPHEGPRAVKEGYQLALSLERCSCSSSQARATWYSVVRM